MRVSRTAGICLAIGLIAVICVGVGYALTPYYGYSYSEDNTTPSSAKTVDIYVDNGEGYVPLTGDMEFPVYGNNNYQPVAVPGDYKIYIKQNGQNATGYVRLWCEMANDASWAVIERMYVTFDGKVDGSGDPIEYNFGVVERNQRDISGQATQAVQLTGEVGFTIYVQFRDIGYNVDNDGEEITSFVGSKFIFAMDGTDPFTS